ncbi:PASTA domain-containing protein [Kitasatospora sp. NPDC058170]|uniref:PASTA domain-containing protein n=1 Tax=Kitasatospora sp. NPDC058170 TaxID=3346364 RepID=UPI0036D7CA94
MRLFCRLCGTRTDGAERLGVYCPGPQCGTDLRAGLNAAVQAWCEPAQQLGEAGFPVLVRLTVRNAGQVSTGYLLEPVEEVEGRLEFDPAVLAAPLPPDRSRTVELRYTPPFDRLGAGLDLASLFGVPGADLAGQVQGARSDRFGVALRVVAASPGQGAACAAFAVDVPGRIDLDWDDRTQDGRDQDDRADRRPSRNDQGAVRRPRIPAAGRRPAPGHHPEQGPQYRLPPRRRGCGPSAVIAVVIAVLAAAVLVFAVGRSRSGPAAQGSPTTPAPTASPAPPPSPSPSASVPRSPSPSGSTRPRSPSPTRPSPSRSASPSASVSPSAKPVTVPDLVGLDQASAEQRLYDLGFAADGDYVDSGGVPELQIIGTDPKAGTRVAPGSTVFLRISNGRAVIPAVAGLTLAEAQKALKAAHLTNVTVSGQGVLDTPLGQAIRTDPEKGTSVALNAPVVLWYAVKPAKPR